MFPMRYSGGMDVHYHLYFARLGEPAWKFETRRELVWPGADGGRAARQWASRLTAPAYPAARYTTRRCDGSEPCIGAPRPDEARQPLPGRRPARRHVPVQVRRIRKALDGLDAAALARIEAIIAEAAA